MKKLKELKKLLAMTFNEKDADQVMADWKVTKDNIDDIIYFVRETFRI